MTELDPNSSRSGSASDSVAWTSTVRGTGGCIATIFSAFTKTATPVSDFPTTSMTCTGICRSKSGSSSRYADSRSASVRADINSLEIQPSASRSSRSLSTPFLPMCFEVAFIETLDHVPFIQ